MWRHTLSHCVQGSALQTQRTSDQIHCTVIMKSLQLNHFIQGGRQGVHSLLSADKASKPCSWENQIIEQPTTKIMSPLQDFTPIKLLWTLMLQRLGRSVLTCQSTFKLSVGKNVKPSVFAFFKCQWICNSVSF